MAPTGAGGGPGRLGRLLQPDSIAFVGGEAAGLAVDQCRALGFEGAMWMVNPGRAPRPDLPVVATVADLPAAPDAAFVGVNRSATIEVVAELAAVGAGSAVCYASGFAEIGGSGERLQNELVTAAAGMPVVGPNCYGTLSAVTGAALWPDQQGLSRCRRGVAFVTQSGNIALNLTMQQRGLDVAHVVTLGNQADVGIEEVLEALAADEAVTAIGAYFEALSDAGRFAEAMDRARARAVPVVVLKSGSTAGGAAIAASHTSSLVGDDTAYDALFRRLGVRRVGSIPELLDTLSVVTAIGALGGNRLVSLSCSGGEAALVADRARHYDLTFPAFDTDHRGRIKATLNEMVTVTNPLDYHTFIWGDRERLEACFTAVLDGRFDAAMLVLDFPRAGLDRSRWRPTLTAFGAAVACTGTTGVVVATMAENLPAEIRAAAAAAGMAAVGGIDAALGGLEAATELGRRTGAAESPRLPLVPAVREVGPSRPVRLTEPEAKARLAEVGIAVPVGEVVPSPEAAEAAARIGFPVVVKAIGLDHKSDAGGVAADLNDSDAVTRAGSRLAALGSGAVLVESMVEGGLVEVLVSVHSAYPIGRLLTVGAGGVLVEVFGDTACVLTPESPEAVRAALERLRVWPLLAGYRGRPPAAVHAVIDVVARLTTLVQSQPDIIEVEVNPLIVTADDAVAVDALITRGTVGKTAGGVAP